MFGGTRSVIDGVYRIQALTNSSQLAAGTHGNLTGVKVFQSHRTAQLISFCMFIEVIDIMPHRAAFELPSMWRRCFVHFMRTERMKLCSETPVQPLHPGRDGLENRPYTWMGKFASDLNRERIDCSAATPAVEFAQQPRQPDHSSQRRAGFELHSVSVIWHRLSPDLP